MKRKILITGASGLVGSHILLNLVDQNNTDIYAIKRKSTDLRQLNNLFEWHGKLSKLKLINWVEADLQLESKVTELPSDIDELIHTAAVVSFNPNDYKIMEKVNIEATENLLQFAKQTGIKKFGFISSIASLGRINSVGVYNEDATWYENDSNSYYSRTKYLSEKSVIASNSNELSTYIVNPGVILGPCDWDKSSGTIFRTGSKGMLFYTSGKNGFVGVEDVANGLLTVMKKGQPGERYILVSQSIPYRDIFNQIAQEFDSRSPRIYSPKWLTGLGWRLDKLKSNIQGKPPTLTKETARNAYGVYEYDNTKISNLGFSFTPINESIQKSIPFFKKYYA